MPYNSRLVRNTEPNPTVDYGEPDPVTGLYPLVPPSQQPEACRGLKCRFEIWRAGVGKNARGEVTFNLLQQDMVGFAHTHDGRTDVYPIPIARLKDSHDDIWGKDIKPWMAQLHEQGEAPASE